MQTNFTFSTCQLPFPLPYKISGERKLIPWTETNDHNCGSDKDSPVDDLLNISADDDKSTHVEASLHGNNSDDELQVLKYFFGIRYIG